jgi:O-antigen/teichoic acid export membrane protein
VTASAATEPTPATETAPLPASPFSSVARGALAILSTQPLTWAATVAAAIWMPLFLGERALGQYVLLWTLAGLVGTAASLGVPDFLVRHVATRPRAQGAADAATAVVLVTLTSSAAGLLLLAALAITGVAIPEGRLLPLALGGMILGVSQGLALALLRGQERYARFAWLNAGSAALGTAIGIAVLALGGDLAAFMVSNLVSLLVGTVITTSRSGIAFSRTAIDPRVMSRLARGGLPFLGWNAALRVYGEIDRILLAVLATEAVIGWYAAAYRIVMVPGFVANLVVTPLLPVLSRTAGDRVAFQDTLRKSIDVVLVASIPVTALTIGLAPSIPGALHWPIGFQNSIPLLTILAFHVPIAGVDVILATALVALHRQNRWLVVGVTAAVFNTSLNFVAIPILQAGAGNGAIAAASVTVLTEILMLGGALVLLPRGMVGRASAGTALRLAVAGAVAAAVGFALQAASLPAAVAAASGAYLLVAVLVGGIRRDQIESAVQGARQYLRGLGTR